MPILDKIVITDASCFITLNKIDGIHLLHSLNKQVQTTPEVAAEFGENIAFNNVSGMCPDSKKAALFRTAFKTRGG